MFRMSDPLGTYSQDPRSSVVRRHSALANVQTQTQNQFQNTPKPQPSSKLPIIIFGIILLICGVSVVVFMKSRPRETSLESSPIVTPKIQQPRKRSQSDYLDFSKISRIANNSREIEEYLTEKIGGITRLEIDPEISRPLNFYNERVGYVQKIKEKVDELLISRERLKKIISEAELVESKAKELHEAYDNKITKIERLGNESLSQVREVVLMNNNISKWRRELEDIHQRMSSEETDFKGKRLDFSESLNRINQDIKAYLKDTKLKEEDLERFVKEKEQQIQEIEEAKRECEQSVVAKKEKLNELRNKNQSLSHDLFQVELESKQKSLQIHSLETAQELEQFVEQIRTIQRAHSEKAKKEIEEIVASIRSKEEEFKQTANEKELVGAEREKALKSLKNMIDNEKILLNTWISEQFKTLRISREEIRNLTTHISDLNRNINSERDQLVELVNRRKSLLQQVSSLPALFNELKAGIQTCTVTIKESERKIEEASREAREHKQIYERVKKLRQQMKERQEVFVKEEKVLEDFKGSLEREKEYIAQTIDFISANVTRTEANIKEIARKINDLVDQEPFGENVMKESQVYWDKVRNAERVYLKIHELAVEIKELI